MPHLAFPRAAKATPTMQKCGMASCAQIRVRLCGVGCLVRCLPANNICVLSTWEARTVARYVRIVLPGEGGWIKCKEKPGRPFGSHGPSETMPLLGVPVRTTVLLVWRSTN